MGRRSARSSPARGHKGTHVVWPELTDRGEWRVEDTSRLYELMIGLGFDRVATEVYGVVLTCGPLARRGIVSILPGLPGQVDDALAVLQGRGLIGSEYRRLRRR